MKKSLLCLACCLILLCAVFATASAEPIAVEAITAEDQIHEENAKLTLTYSLRLPSFRDDRAEAINKNFADLLDYYKTAFIPMLYAENKAEWADANIPIEITLDYAVRMNDGETVSVVYFIEVSMGDAPEETYFAETYRLSDGKRLFLTDFTNLTEPALAMATREVARQIQAATDGAWNYLSTADENYLAMYLSEESFYVDENGGVVLFVNPSAITDSRSGICEFPVEASVLGK